MKTTDLDWLVKQEKEEIDAYLSNVPSDQFQKDIESLIKKYTDKGVIQQAIDKLKELL